MAIQLAMSFEQKRIISEEFKAGVLNLNHAQREAVEQIEGPVLVVAGPGTGKTEILALRIGNILQQTDVNPDSILCLTFTEAGTHAMRKRLLKYIGPTAYNVHINTFHAFCNKIIQDNRSEFGYFRELSPVSDLERIEIFRTLIDQIPEGHELKRLTGKRYYDLARLQWLFETLKRENKTPEQLAEDIERKIEDLKSDPDYILKRASKNGNVGDLNYKGKKKIVRYETTQAAANLLPEYNRLLQENGRYDFSDMILWVLKAFQQNEDFLAYYQEKYQYILVDEYQDTNGSQNDILYKLCDYWDRPNVFAVGDDDQAIFRFQGANMTNVIDYTNRFKPQIIFLSHNYRSTQNILDWSSRLIGENRDRLVHHIDGMSKNLRASSGHAHATARPIIVEYASTAQEEADIYSKIISHHEAGSDLNDIAIIYRNHRQVDNLVTVLERVNIPINIRRKVNILELPLILNIVNLLQYLQAEYDSPHSAEFRLFEIMHYPYFKISPADVASIALACRYRREQPKKHWRPFMGRKQNLIDIEIEDIDQVTYLDRILNDWVRNIHSVTLQVFFEKILKEGNVLQHIMESEDKIWLLQVVNTLFEFIKEETSKKPSLTLKELLAMLDNMQEHAIQLPLNKIVHADQGVHFVTAHGAKGLEFDTVFIMGASQNFWDEKYRRGGDTFELPYDDTSDVNMDVEDERRLFYVAMTRAKKHLHISYAVEGAGGKEQSATRFIAELLSHTDHTPQAAEPADKQVIEFYTQLMTPEEKEIELVDKEWIDFILQDLKISATALNKYLRCPITFYFENILRVPSARTEYLGFGSAVHAAMEDFFREFERTSELPAVDRLIDFFEKGMEDYHAHFTDKEYKDRMIFGKQVLKDYYRNYHPLWGNTKKVWLEERFQNIECEGVPISGVLDRVDEYNDYVIVVDYKTGSVENAKRDRKVYPPKLPEDAGGDYWRQIVFYKLLIDHHPSRKWNMKKGYMDFIQPTKKGPFYRESYEVTPEQEAKVKEQLKDTYQKIKNYEFSEGCNDDKCYWCNFVKYHFDATILNEDELYIFD